MSSTLSKLHLVGSRAAVSSRCCATSAMSAASGRIVSAERRRDERMLHVRWQDGEQAVFPYVWLRDAAPHDHRPRFMADLSVAVEPEQLQVDRDGALLRIQWPPYQWVPYDSTWLRSALSLVPDSGNSPAAESAGVRPRGPAAAVAAYACDAIRERRGEIVGRLEADGCVRLTGCEQRHPAGVMHLLGLCNETETEADVCSEHGAMCDVMGLHTGRPNDGTPPKWLAIHVRRVASGYEDCRGALQVSDGFAVATHMRRHHPADFQLLTTTPIEYANGGGDKGVHTVIRLNGGGKPATIVYNHALRSVRLPCAASRAADYYGALQRFSAAAYKHSAEVRPRAGDMLLVDNRRVLHGNSAFRDDGGRPLCQLTETFFG